MSETVNLRLPFMEASQSQKHVTHNDALLIIDAAVHLSVLDAARTSPPASPVEGDRHIVAVGATGGWLDHDHAVATYSDGGWLFLDPRAGWRAWSVEDEGLLVFDGSLWRDVRNLPMALDNLSQLGVGTTADATNPVSAKVNNTLWTARTTAEGGDGNLRYKLSKEDATKTLSFLFQDNYSGRAEIGLCGDDNFHFKVSPDGTSWYEGIRVDRTNGKVVFPISGGPREVLTANRTYYVRTDGSDSNDGSADSAGGAFLTLQKALDVVATIDFNGYIVTIQLGDGTYSNTTTAVPVTVGQASASKLIIQGNASTPANVVLDNPTAWSGAINVATGARVRVKDLKITGGTNAYGLAAKKGGELEYTGVNFGAVGRTHLYAASGGIVTQSGAYTISGGSDIHFMAENGGHIFAQSSTITVSGTPAFASGFAYASGLGTIVSQAAFSGSATGKRYDATANALIQTYGGGASYFPGNSAGTTATGGLYQ
jgi:hypothetical protein